MIGLQNLFLCDQRTDDHFSCIGFVISGSFYSFNYGVTSTLCCLQLKQSFGLLFSESLCPVLSLFTFSLICLTVPVTYWKIRFLVFTRLEGFFTLNCSPGRLFYYLSVEASFLRVNTKMTENPFLLQKSILWETKLKHRVTSFGTRQVGGIRVFPHIKWFPLYLGLLF